MTLISGWRPEGYEYDEYMSGPKSGTFRRCKFCGDLHEISNWPDNHRDEPPPRSELASPAFISDNLESQGGLNGLQCQVSGKFFTSKKKMRDEYRARGVTEVGTDPQRSAKFKAPKPDRSAIKNAVRRAAWQVEHEGARVENFRKRSKQKPTMFGPQNAKAS